MVLALGKLKDEGKPKVYHHQVIPVIPVIPRQCVVWHRICVPNLPDNGLECLCKENSCC